MDIFKILGAFGLVILTGLAIVGTKALFYAYPIMLLWNKVIPQVTGFSRLDFWQSFYICLLVILLTNEFNTNDSK